MKTTFNFFLLLICSTMITYGQAVKEQDVPAIVRQSLNQKYPGVQAKKWTLEEDVYEAEVVLQNKEAEAAFDKTGKWIETEQEIEISEIPASIKNTIQNSAYKAWKIKEVEAIESPDNIAAYEIELKNNNEKITLLFSKNGSLIKTEKD